MFHTHRISALIPSSIPVPAVCAAAVLAAGLVRFSWHFGVVLAIVGFFLLLPGFGLVQLVVRQPLDVLERLALAFSFGLLLDVLFFLALTIYGRQFSFTFISIVFTGLIVAVTAAALLHRRFSGGAPSGPSPVPVTWAPFYGALGLVFILLFNENALLLTSDSLYYVEKIKEWAASGLFGQIHTDRLSMLLGVTRLYHTGVQPFFLALSHVPAVEQYAVLTSIMAFFWPCSFYFLNKRLWNDRRFIALGAFLFLAAQGGLVFNFIHINYSWLLGWNVYFTAAGMLIEYSRGRDRNDLAVFLGFFLAIWCIHGAFFIMLFFSALFFGTALFYYRNRESRVGRAVIAAVCAILLGSFLVFFLDVFVVRIPFADHWGVYRGSEPIRGHMKLFGTGYIPSLTEFPLKYLTLWGILSFVMLPFALRLRSGDISSESRVFLVSHVVLPPLVLFNPLLASGLVAVIRPTGMERLFFIIPFISILALSLIVFWDRIGTAVRRRLRTAGRTALVLLMVITGFSVFCYRSLQLMPSSWGHVLQPYVMPLTGFRTGPLRYDHQGLINALRAIRGGIAPSALFVTDPLTAEFLTLFLPNPVLEEWRPRFIRTSLKKSESMRILGAWTMGAETVKAMRRSGASYVLVNRSFNGQMISRYFSRIGTDPDVLFSLDKFDKLPKYFEKVYQRNGYTIYHFIQSREIN